MKRTFIETGVFTRQWQEIGYSEEDLRQLQNQIMENPKIGKVIPGTGHLRKMRFSVYGKGKRGGSRVCYVDYALYDTVYLMTVYTKNEKQDLTIAERNNMKKVILQIERNLSREAIE